MHQQHYNLPADRSCRQSERQCVMRQLSQQDDTRQAPVSRVLLNTHTHTRSAHCVGDNLNGTSHALARLCFAIVRQCLIKMQFDLDTAAKLNQSILISLCTLSFDLNQRPFPLGTAAVARTADREQIEKRSQTVDWKRSSERAQAVAI